MNNAMLSAIVISLMSVIVVTSFFIFLALFMAIELFKEVGDEIKKGPR
jgi:hypothetical protein